jgi:DNA-binding NarL/FixJ family response regulator
MYEKKQIGIVDDHVLFRKSLKILIDLFPDYKVICDASNGKEFLEQLKPANLPHIVLMDIGMPVMDGYVTTSWLRDHYPDVKVLALSTMNTETAIIKMIRSGAKGFVLKDAEPSELQLAFEEVIRRGYFYNDLITHKVLNAVHHLSPSINKADVFANLSEREIIFLRWTCTELTYKEIADKMFLSVRTIEGYRDALCEKLNLRTRVGLAMYAIKNNLVSI